MSDSKGAAIDKALQDLIDGHIDAIKDLTRVGPRKTPNVYFNGPILRAELVKAKQAILAILAQEVNKAQLDILIWATGGIKEFTEDGKIYIPKKIDELTAPNRKAGLV